MDIRQLTPALSVAPQISAADVPALARAGFRSVICNRPDGEAIDQAAFQAIERACAEQGLQARYLPAETGKVSDAQGQAFGALMKQLPQPVLAYCRSGLRSATMWALSQAGQMPPASILETTGSAGYDLTPLAHRLE